MPLPVQKMYLTYHMQALSNTYVRETICVFPQIVGSSSGRN